MKNLRRYISLVILLAVTLVHVQASEEDRVFYAYDASNGLADNNAQTVMTTKTGRIMVTTLGHVNFFDGSSFRHIDPQNSDAYPLPGYDGRYQLCFDKMHHLWIKHDHMMTCVNLTTETFIHDIPSVFREMGVKGVVYDFFGDGESNVWFRTGNKIYSPGVNKTFQIYDNAVLQEVDVYRDSLLMMFHADGSVVVLDYHTGRLLRHDYAFEGADRTRYSNFSEVCLMNHHYFQIRSSEEEAVLMCYNIDTRLWSVVMRQPFKMKALYPVGDLLYIGSSKGYFTYHTRKGELHHYETLTLSKGRSQTPDITSIAFDRQGGMWLGTERRGLLFCKEYKSPFHTYLLNTPEADRYVRLLDEKLQTQQQQVLARKINCVFTDSRGWKWTGSYNGLELERPSGRREVFDTQNGLTNDVVHSIAEDKDHDIWVSTSYGVSHLFIRQGKVYHVEPYINQDNIPSEMFLNDRATTLDDGTIIMQSLDHVVVFNPSEFRGKKFGNIAINPKLIHLYVNGNSIEAGQKLDGKVIIEKAVSRSAEINVNYNQNSLSFIFSGLNYLRPIQTYYRVRIKGTRDYDDWRIFSFSNSHGMVDKFGLLHLPVLGLEPGTYVLEMQTSMWPETWTQEPYRWTIHVEQPWWRTTGVYLSLAFLVLIFLVLNFLLYNHNMQMRMVMNNEEFDILRQIKTFAARCKNITPESVEAYAVSDAAKQETMSEDFVRAMQLIVPYVNDHHDDMFTIGDLADVARVDKKKLYELLSSNLHKSPRLFLSKIKD